MDYIISWNDYSLVESDQGLKVISHYSNRPEINVYQEDGEIRFERLIQMKKSETAYEFREAVKAAKAADEAISMFELFLEDSKAI